MRFFFLLFTPDVNCASLRVSVSTGCSPSCPFALLTNMTSYGCTRHVDQEGRVGVGLHTAHSHTQDRGCTGIEWTNNNFSGQHCAISALTRIHTYTRRHYGGAGNRRQDSPVMMTMIRAQHNSLHTHAHTQTHASTCIHTKWRGSMYYVTQWIRGRTAASPQRGEDRSERMKERKNGKGRSSQLQQIAPLVRQCVCVRLCLRTCVRVCDTRMVQELERERSEGEARASLSTPVRVFDGGLTRGPSCERETVQEAVATVWRPEVEGSGWDTERWRRSEEGGGAKLTVADSQEHRRDVRV